jgi:hypothetical protein
MLSALNRLIVRTSSSPMLFLAATVVMVATLAAILRIGASFPAIAGGAEPFDLQNGLTAADVLRQLPGYTVEARRQYALFTAIDYVFPFAAGLFLAAVIAFCLRRSFPGVYAALDARRLLPVLMLATLFDWSENVLVLAAIQSWPDTSGALATAIVVAKRLKLACVFLSQGLAVLLLLVTAVKSLRGRRAAA